jgi:hypothetical protein
MAETTPGFEDVHATLAEWAGLEISEAVRQRIDKAVLDGQRIGGSYRKEFWRLAIDPESVPLTNEQEQLVEGLFDCLAHGWVSKAGPGMQHGVWDHFKGGLYLSLGIATDAERDCWQVEYLSLYHATRHHRRVGSWNEVVKWPDGRYRSRFIYRGPTLEADPPSFRVPPSEKLRAHLVKARFGLA